MFRGVAGARAKLTSYNWMIAAAVACAPLPFGTCGSLRRSLRSLRRWNRTSAITGRYRTIDSCGSY
jgi:hypothetical protein